MLCSIFEKTITVKNANIWLQTEIKQITKAILEFFKFVRLNGIIDFFFWFCSTLFCLKYLTITTTRIILTTISPINGTISRTKLKQSNIIFRTRLASKLLVNLYIWNVSWFIINIWDFTSRAKIDGKLMKKQNSNMQREIIYADDCFKNLNLGEYNWIRS